MIKKYVTLRVNNITDEDLIIETTGYNINYQYKNSDLISYCNLNFQTVASYFVYIYLYQRFFVDF